MATQSIWLPARQVVAGVVLAMSIVLVAGSGAAAQQDTDGDGLSDGAEDSSFGTDPERADSDGDGLPDGVEIALGTDPLAADTDGDGARDAEEFLAGSDPLVSSDVPGEATVVSTTEVSEPEAPSTVTVSAPDALAFDDAADEPSALFPLYLLMAVAISVGMVAGVAALPELARDRSY
jgi:hypothetical protein